MERKLIIILLAIVALLIPAAIIGYMTLIPIVGDAIIQSDPKYPECKRLDNEIREAELELQELFRQVDSLKERQSNTNDFLKSNELIHELVKVSKKALEKSQLVYDKRLQFEMKCFSKQERIELSKKLGPEVTNEILKKYPNFLE